MKQFISDNLDKYNMIFSYQNVSVYQFVLLFSEVVESFSDCVPWCKSCERFLCLT